MGDEEDGLPLRRQILHDLHQLVDLLRGQHGGRLVENEDLIVAVEHLQDLGTLLHTHGDVLNDGVGVNAETVLLRNGQHLLTSFFLLQKAVLHRLYAHDDVVQHAEALHQLKVLVHHADAQVVGIIGVLDLYLNAILTDGALLGLVKAKQHRHQRGLTRAVLAQQRMDLTLTQLQGDVIIGDDTGELFGDVQHFNGILIFQRETPSFPLCTVKCRKMHIL